MPSNRLTVGLPEIIKPLTRAIPKATVASIENGKSLLVISFVILIGCKIEHTPTTTRRLKNLLHFLQQFHLLPVMKMKY